MEGCSIAHIPHQHNVEMGGTLFCVSYSDSRTGADLARHPTNGQITHQPGF